MKFLKEKLYLLKRYLSLRLFGKIRLNKIKKEFPIIKDTKETIDYIINNKASIVRYGDGELGFVRKNNYKLDFQRPSNQLSYRLKEILKSSDKRILICLPPFKSEYNNSKNICCGYSFWEIYWFQYFNKLKQYFNNKVYYNAFISRLDVFVENDVNKIKKIWKDREVVFVYGKNGRFDKNCILFDNIKNSKEIRIPAIDAFDEYDEILNNCLKMKEDSLFIIAAGPTATVLAYDLAKKGYQALDLGHLPNSYDQYLGNITKPEDIPMLHQRNTGIL